MSTNYWAKTLHQRLSRRRTLVATSASAIGAGLLAACGGSDSNEGGTSSKQGAGILFKPADTSKEATKGGTLQSFMGGNVEHFDQVTGNFATQAHTDHVYSRLVR